MRRVVSQRDQRPYLFIVETAGVDCVGEGEFTEWVSGFGIDHWQGPG